MNVTIVNCFDTYGHRVDLLVSFFKKRGDHVEVYTSNFCHIEKEYCLDKKEHYIYCEARPYYKNLSVRRLYSHWDLARKIFDKIQHRDIQLLWVLIPPNSFVKAGAKMKRKNPHMRMVFDVIDMWPETMPIRKVKNAFPFRIWKNMRDRYLTQADYIITECQLYQETLKAVVNPKNLRTLYLARAEKKINKVSNLPEDRTSLCYLGSINNIIDIPAIFALIYKLAEDRGVELHIIGDGENRDELIKAAKKAGAKVIYHGKIYDDKKKQAIFNTCHYGLNMMKSTVCVGLSMKSVDYFEAGLPVINNISGDVWTMIEEHKLGVNISSPDIYIQNSDEKMRQNVRLFFKKNFTTEVFENKLEEILEALENSM